jgi:hypothetical protein
MKRFLLLSIISLISFIVTAQKDSSRVTHLPTDSTNNMNMDAVYNRPFLGIGKAPVALGGYLEGNWQYASTDGVSEGHQFQARRLTLFAASKITRNLKFLTEIEFEEGGKEIAIEFASLDVELHHLLNLRGGIVMNPIGAFNQNHDGPKWEFIDRPIAATQMLPATWSNAGFGAYGKTFSGKWMFGYEFYLTGSFDNSVIENGENRTFLPASKLNPERFEEISSGKPLVNGKVAMRYGKLGEIGISYMGGIYNKWQDDGLIIDDQRRLDVFAIDWNSTIPKANTKIIGEFAWIFVEIPENYSPFYGNKQYGGFVDIVQPVLKRKILGWNNAVVNLSCRLEYVDWNVGRFSETNGTLGDYVWSLVPSISLRPSAQTVFRFNYRYQEQTDLFNNPAALTGAFSFGFSTYF